MAHSRPRYDSYRPDGLKVHQVYDREIDRLIGRTIRAYRLIVNYQRDCPGGCRWMPAHIDMIHKAGKKLDTDREALEDLRLSLGRSDDAGVVSKVRDAAHALRECCEEMQELIRIHERVPVFNGKDLEWSGQDRSAGVQSRDSLEVTGDTVGIRVRHDSHVEQRGSSPLTQPEGCEGIVRYGRAGRYFASDTWRPT